MNKIIILMFMLNSFVFGADINSLIEEPKNDTDNHINSLIEQLKNDDENEEVLYKILSFNQNMLHEMLELEDLEQCYIKDFAVKKIFELTSEFAHALQIFIGEKNNCRILSCKYLSEENLMKAIFFSSEGFAILELYSTNVIRPNESKSVDILFDNKNLTIKKINFRYRNSSNKSVKLPKKKFFIFEFSEEDEKYLLTMSIQ